MVPVMILGPPQLENPFQDPHLRWCEVQFAVADVTALSQDVPGQGAVSIALPPDLQTAVAKRRSEFLAGRFCAALALRQAGLPETVGRQGRAPLWPQGVAGTITHSKDRAIAAVSSQYRGLGLDCEALVPQDRALQLSAAIFTETESRLRPDALPYASFFTLVFSAKEALYKALSHRLSHVPDFLEPRLMALNPGIIDLQFQGELHKIRFRLSRTDCVCLATD